LRQLQKTVSVIAEVDRLTTDSWQ